MRKSNGYERSRTQKRKPLPPWRAGEKKETKKRERKQPNNPKKRWVSPTRIRSGSARGKGEVAGEKAGQKEEGAELILEGKK